MGRKKIEIDWQVVDNYLMAGADGTEVAAAIGINPETLYDRCVEVHKTDFSDYKATKRAKGDSLIRVKQYDLAVKGDRSMLVWLGKNRLGQSDKKEIRQENYGQLVNVQFTSTGIEPIRSENDIQDGSSDAV